MPSLKNKTITLFLLALVYLWFFVGHLPNLNQAKDNLLTATTNVSIFVQPDTGKSIILDAINNAKHEILVEVYLLSDKDVIQALEAARTRGLAVNVMLEQHPFGGGNLNNKTKIELSSKGISVEWTNPSFSLTHEKTITIDGREVFILNQNLTASSFFKNREYDVLDKNQNDVNQIRSIFVSDWERKTFTPVNSDLVISPDNSRAKVIGLINSSLKSIDIEAENIDDNQVISSLSNLAKKEKIRLIVPSLKQLSSNRAALNELLSKGVEVKALSSPYMHAKLILVDDKNAYIGSINLSSQSIDKNREVGIILSEPFSLQTLQYVFEKDWSKASDISKN